MPPGLHGRQVVPSEDVSLKLTTLLAHSLPAASLAALLQQAQHETVHGVTAVLVGKRWEFLNLFAAGSSWTGEPHRAADAVVAGAAAVADIACGAACVILYYKNSFVVRPTWRLFLVYAAGFSLLAGFGYLMVDALFYNADDPDVTDWQKVIQYLGGSWQVRLPILLAGAAGSLFPFFWLPNAALRFTGAPLSREIRVRIAAGLLLIPYLVVNTLLSCLAIWHPLGLNGLILVAVKTWAGYSAFFWAYLIAGYWARVAEPIRKASPLPPRPRRKWLLAAAAGVCLAAILLLPGAHARD
jgi:hypothetical protein